MADDYVISRGKRVIGLKLQVVFSPPLARINQEANIGPRNPRFAVWGFKAKQTGSFFMRQQIRKRAPVQTGPVYLRIAILNRNLYTNPGDDKSDEIPRQEEGTAVPHCQTSHFSWIYMNRRRVGQDLSGRSWNLNRRDRGPTPRFRGLKGRPILRHLGTQADIKRCSPHIYGVSTTTQKSANFIELTFYELGDEECVTSSWSVRTHGCSVENKQTSRRTDGLSVCMLIGEFVGGGGGC